MTCSPPTLKPSHRRWRTRSSEVHYINLTHESLLELSVLQATWIQIQMVLPLCHTASATVSVSGRTNQMELTT